MNESIFGCMLTTDISKRIELQCNGTNTNFNFVYYAYHVGFIVKVEENICKFAKKGLTPSQIGVILRDSHGIAQVKSVTGSKILRILKAHGVSFFISTAIFCFIFEDK